MFEINSKRGFITTIGDDLPSLIPLIFALVIFFATFGRAFEVYRASASEFELVDTTAAILSKIKGDGYYSNVEEFKKRCSLANPGYYSFKAALISAPEYFEPLEIEKFLKNDFGVISQNSSKFVCSEIRNEFSSKTSAKYVLVPVVYEDRSVASGFAIKPAFLLVVVWR